MLIPNSLPLLATLCLLLHTACAQDPTKATEAVTMATY